MEFMCIGMHHPYDAGKVAVAFVSINVIKDRKSAFPVGKWIMDSGAFTTIAKHGGYPEPPETYAAHIRRWASNGDLLAAVSQDYMCEKWMLEKTGLTIEEHQRLTIERYDAIMAAGTNGVYLMPVLQGYDPIQYVDHICMYGDRLGYGAWVGVGSVCKRNGSPRAIEDVLLAIKKERPDLKLHGFGIKTTSLRSGLVRELLHSADSMAWSFAARKKGKNANCWKEAQKFETAIDTMQVQYYLFNQDTL
jgi:hypothetical protein